MSTKGAHKNTETRFTRTPVYIYTSDMNDDITPHI